jgi:hypothetical protein
MAKARSSSETNAQEVVAMKKITKRTKRAKPRTKAKTNPVKTRSRTLSVGELDQVYGGQFITDPGTKDSN